VARNSKTQSRPVTLRLRIIVVQPPAGVQFRLQERRSDLVAPAHETRGELQFDFSLRLGPPRQGRLNFLGLAAQGPPAHRFIYINSGRRAGQQETCWDRRAKVPLTAITKALVQAALSDVGVVLEARIAGTASDGGPVCATAPLIGGGWRVVPKAAA
jgi:Family of unknown function (DUF5990)